MNATQKMNKVNTKLILRGLSAFGQPNLCNWQPEYPGNFAEVISADIGHRRRVGNDTFSIRVATPAGLAGMESREGIIAMRPLLVMDKFDYDYLWSCSNRLSLVVMQRIGRSAWRNCSVSLTGSMTVMSNTRMSYLQHSGVIVSL